MNGDDASESGLLCACHPDVVSGDERPWHGTIPHQSEFVVAADLRGGESTKPAFAPRQPVVTPAFVDARLRLFALLLSEEARGLFLSLRYEEQASIVIVLVGLGFLP